MEYRSEMQGDSVPHGLAEVARFGMADAPLLWTARQRFGVGA